MTSFITTRLLGYVSGGLSLLLCAAVLFGYVQTGKLVSANDVIKALRSEVATLTVRIEDNTAQIATRDHLITTQNTAVQAMAQASLAESAAYKARIAAADKVASLHQKQAADIMKREASSTDELQRGREALKLIQEMVGPASRP